MSTGTLILLLVMAAWNFVLSIMLSNMEHFLNTWSSQTRELMQTLKELANRINESNQAILDGATETHELCKELVAEMIAAEQNTAIEDTEKIGLSRDEIRAMLEPKDEDEEGNDDAE